jgi:hypothetical protein
MSDRIVEEIHEIRRRLSEECNFDFDKLGAYYMRLQEAEPANLVSEVPATEPESAAQESL